MSKTIRIALLGATGRMGLALVREIAAHPRAELSAAIAAPAHDGADIFEMAGLKSTGLLAGTDLYAALDGCDVLIDFSTPKSAIDAALLMHEVSCGAMVSGTTGFTGSEERAFDAAAQAVCVVRSGNFSLGVNVLTALVEQASKALPADFDIDILDVHHKYKADAPSGTALMLGAAAAKGRGQAAPDARNLRRNQPRKDGEIGFAAMRVGGVTGDHDVIFGSEMETLTLSHRALDRAVFARGALVAALWAAGQSAGHYDMRDVLGLNR
ncbi:4-hydroxy-tetrahydrodipicolinate reductase [Robiginitomaculum antarcticum]|uniref:4-hydroxy-tetrahydrodipicolinate reductase n=1 Tax=Robiginitomaculum antarcticum TaxID=437507 RepID=UPI00036671B3|nr:4-hydroxy-tetrahydrodipicolinate reductase [Robiginitomaculum antarcticum]